MNRSLGLGLVLVVIAAAVLTYMQQTSEPTPGAAGGGAVGETSADASSSATTPQPGVRYDDNGIAVGGIEPNPKGGVPLNIDNILANADKATVVSLDEADTFTVPTPDDPEWADYLEYRRHFRTALDNSPGFVVAYDPEWRTQLEGKRPAPDPGYELFGGDSTLRGLVQQVLDALVDEDEQFLLDLAIRKEEYEIICWPSFPQSRPFLRYKWEEGWGFQYASLVGGIKEGLRQGGGRSLDLEDLAYKEIQDFDHFQLYEGLTIGARDRDTGERVELTFLETVIERNGIFKVFLYAD